MSKHSAGRWTLRKQGECYHVLQIGETGPWRTVATVSPVEVITGSGDHSIGLSEAQANAARVVACVNACEGIENPSVVPDLFQAIAEAHRELCRAIHFGDVKRARVILEEAVLRAQQEQIVRDAMESA